MSESKVELLHRFYEAFNARDIEALIACCDPSIEFHSTFAAVGGGVYHGHDGMREVLSRPRRGLGRRDSRRNRGVRRPR
jgi:ketosteroid isomerase-like protein